MMTPSPLLLPIPILLSPQLTPYVVSTFLPPFLAGCIVLPPPRKVTLMDAPDDGVDDETKRKRIRRDGDDAMDHQGMLFYAT